MKKIELNSKETMEELRKRARSDEGVLIFKHSTRCGISSWAWKQFQRDWDQSWNIPVFFLDLLKNRDLSNRIAEELGVRHESPQLIWVRKGQVGFHTSHSGLTVDSFRKHKKAS
jgi:bacillithiol system protein YtxJ